jgi:hypothetical protein
MAECCPLKAVLGGAVGCKWYIPLMEVPALHLQGVDMQIGYLSRGGDYAEPVSQSPRFPVKPRGKLGIFSKHWKAGFRPYGHLP